MLFIKGRIIILFFNYRDKIILGHIMKVLSLTEPFATLISGRIKSTETRSWKTNYRGILYIHASSTKIPSIYKDNRELMSLIAERILIMGTSYVLVNWLIV